MHRTFPSSPAPALPTPQTLAQRTLLWRAFTAFQAQRFQHTGSAS